jgi:hypothetical protein
MKTPLFAIAFLDMPDEFWLSLRPERDHDLRAVLICLATAAFVAQGTATIIGESIGGLVLAAALVIVPTLGETRN